MSLPHTAVAPLELIAQAQQALAAQQWEQALALARQALTLPMPEPARAEALFLVGQSHWREGDLLRVQRAALQAAALAMTQGLTPLQIRSLGLASIALSELNLADEALSIALRALELARQPEQHEQLPGALSCAAHVYARLCDLENAELMHMQALSLAREVGEVSALYQAYCNLLASFIVAHKELSAGGHGDAATAVLARAQRYTSHTRSLLTDTRMDEYRRLPLLLNLGHVLLLMGRLDEAEPLLLQAQQLAVQQAANYYRLSACQTLAELRLLSGEPAQALALLHEVLTPAPGLGVFSLQLSALRTALACHLALGQDEQVGTLSAELAAMLQAREVMRQQALRS